MSSRAISTRKLRELDAKRDLREEARLIVQRASAMRARREASDGRILPAVPYHPRKTGCRSSGIVCLTNLTSRAREFLIERETNVLRNRLPGHEVFI